MNLRHISFRVILFLVAILHCFGLVRPSFEEIELYDSSIVELVDIDSNESDSEEREEELKVFDCDTNKVNSLLIDLVKIHDINQIVSYCSNKVQSPFLSNPYSPPELKI
jgi:hypothetical protein